MHFDTVRLEAVIVDKFFSACITPDFLGAFVLLEMHPEAELEEEVFTTNVTDVPFFARVVLDNVIL